MIVMIDLHTHSTASDGTFSPAELAAEAHKAGLSLFALTDHDTVAGVAEAQQAGKTLGIRVLPGIEISVEWQPGELHLLGLGIDSKNATLASLMQYAQEKRVERNRRIIEKFYEAGIVIDEEKLAHIAGGPVIGRPHFAKYLVESGKVKTIQDAFQKYLAKGRPFYIEKVAPATHHTMGGVAINEKAQVKSENGGLVDGLFAAGEVVGGIHGTNRLGGNAITDVITFGRIAGTSVLQK